MAWNERARSSGEEINGFFPVIPLDSAVEVVNCKRGAAPKFNKPNEFRDFHYE